MASPMLDTKERLAVVESRVREHAIKLKDHDDVIQTIHEWRGGFRALGGLMIIVQVSTAILTLYLNSHH